jgi:NAD(P)H-dependent FMN reductase
MLKVGIITGSTRPNRKSLEVARWVLEIAQRARTRSTSSSTSRT